MNKKEIAYLSCKILSLLGVNFALGFAILNFQLHISNIFSINFNLREVIKNLLISIIPTVVYLLAALFLWFKSEYISNRIFPVDTSKDSIPESTKNINIENIIILSIVIVGISILSAALINTAQLITSSIYYYFQQINFSGYKNNEANQILRVCIHWTAAVCFIFFPKKILLIIKSIQKKFKISEHSIFADENEKREFACDKCGAAVKEREKYCHNCGEKFE